MGSGYKAFSAGEILTSADLNNYCQSQSVMYFATTTARDAAITSPVDGMTCYIGSNDNLEGLYTYNGTSWRRGPGWNAPWGVLLYKQKTSGTQNITTAATLTDLTQSTSLIDNRLYRFSFVCQFSNSTAGAINAFQMRVGSTVIQKGQIVAGNAVNTFNYTAVGWYEATSTGAQTLDVQGIATSGTLVITNSSDAPSQLIVEDMGPAGAPV